MRLHISLDDSLVEELDERVGARRRSPFISAAVRRALSDERRWETIMSVAMAADAGEHAWDENPAAWVRDQRRSDLGRVG
jgi:metal-responsive CopG/Arc/MetJ family transcriptional regulator